MIKIKLKAFGVFSDFIGTDFVVLKLDASIEVIYLKKIISENFKFSDNLKLLLESSVFSNESDILIDSYIINNNDTIYLLPPVSGG